jgi:hypothetical protein
MTTMERWLDEACQLLGLPDVPGPDLTDQVLALARDVAHGIARPAAPLTTYLLGLAVGAAHADAAEVERLAALISTAAASHREPGEAAE